MGTSVQILLYSGRPNFSFVLDPTQEARLWPLVQARLAGPTVAERPAASLGYRGFLLAVPAGLALPAWLVIGQGLILGPGAVGTTAWIDTDGACEALLKGEIVQNAPEVGAPVRAIVPEIGAAAALGAIRPQGVRLGLAEELLASALDFARHALADLSRAILTDVATFAAAAGKPGFADDGTVSTQLELARGRFALIAPSMEAGDLSAAAEHIAVLLGAIDAASTRMNGFPLRDLVIDNIGWGGLGVGGLAAGLGLPGGRPDGLSFKTDTLSYSIETGARTLAPGLASFEAATIEARLRGDGAAPAFSIALRMRQVEIGVGGGPISALLGGAGGSLRADIALGVDTVHGLTLGDGASRTMVLPARTGAGLIDLREVTLALPDDQPDFVQAGATIKLKLGPIDLTVEGAGIEIHVNPDAVSDGANPLSIGLKAPDGIGVQLDTGIVRGGGFLGERSGGYGGALSFRVGPVEVDAFGILTLKPEFALVIVMSMRFTPAIDLSFGFTLNAVGGVIGLNHVLDGDALAAQVSTGGIEHILFPEDPVASAPAILHTLEQVFPQSDGGFVIGPMLELGWGRPVSFVTAQIGVILSLPDPKIAIIGRGRLALPAPQLPIVDLRVTVVGLIDSDHFFMRASLAGSHIAAYPVQGDVGMVLRWNGGAEMAISAGGFHPLYTPPRELTGMSRLGMDMSPPAILRMRAQSYFAVTSNSVQFGAQVDLSADLEVASIEGHLNIDALVIYAPHFRFLADLSFGISVRAFGEQVGGVSAQLHFSGPSPWIAEGHGEAEIFGFSVPVDFGPFTWGDAHNPPPEPADPRQLVHDALDRNPGAWQVLLGPGADRVVRLKPADPAQVDILVHPLSLFEVRQRAVPLETVLARVGPSPVPEGKRRVHLGLPIIGGGPASSISEATDLFASGNYLDLSDDEKLSRPGFEAMPAGVKIQPAGAKAEATTARAAELRYETFVCDDDSLIGRFSRLRPDGLFLNSLASTLAAGAAGATPQRAATRYATPPNPIEFADPGQVAQVSKATVAVIAGSSVRTYAHAAEQSLAQDVQLARLGVAA